MLRCELGLVRVVFAIFSCADWVFVEVLGESGSHGGLLEAWSIRGRLASELSEIEIFPGFVTEVHRFGEPALRIVTIENNGVDGDGNDLYNDFNEGADECPALEDIVSMD